MKNKIKYGILGAGHLGNYHANQLKKISSVDLVGVYDINKKKSKELKEAHNIKQFSSESRLLSSCDAVSIATPASSHFQSAEKALKAGCHVFIEKPITNNVKDARQLIKLKQTKLQVGHIERFNAAFSCLQSTNPSPLFIEAHRLCAFNQRGLDVDVILDLMIHDIDLVLLLVNSKIKNIYASGTKVLTNSIDVANARLEFQNGAVANLTASRISLKQMRQMRIFQKKSYQVVDFQAQTLRGWIINNKNNLEEKIYKVVPKNALFEELTSFIACIIKDLPEKMGADDAIQSLAIASQIQQKIDQSKQ